jgi:drug/metabolite transporter (DMT)-like permease
MAEITWFLLGLVGPFLYALTNHIDKHLLSTYFKEDGVLTLIMYSAMLALCVVPVAFFFDTNVLGVETKSMLALAGVAALDVLLLWAYLSALNEDEPTVVIVFYALVPVLGLVFGHLILGESITGMQGVAMAIVIVGASLMTVELEVGNNFRLRLKTAGYMLIACTAWAMETTIFKMVALEENVWRSLFWECLMLGTFGVLVFVLSRKYRHAFLLQFKKNSAGVVSLNVLNEGIYALANIAVAFAAMLAPVALVLLLNAFQPMFVMIIGAALAFLVPKLATERATRHQIVHRMIAIVITGIGTYVLLGTGVEV